MNRAAKGRRNEHRSMGYLEKLQYYGIRSAGSHGAIDVVGLKIEEGVMYAPMVRLIQSKTGGKYSNTDLTTLRILRDTSTASVLNTILSAVEGLPQDIQDKLVLLLGSIFTPRFELHNWEKFQRYPEITILGKDKGDDISIIDE